MTATVAYYENRIAQLEAERARTCELLIESIEAGERLVEKIDRLTAAGDRMNAAIDRMVTRCNEGCASAPNEIVYAAYASVLGALNDLTAPTQAFVEAEPGDERFACADGTHTRDCTGPCPDPDDVRDRARERAEDGE